MPSPLGVASGYSHNGLPLLLCLSLPFPFGLQRREFPPPTSVKMSTQKAGINNRNDAAGPVRIESGMDLPAGATYLLTGERDSGRQFVSQGQKLLASCNFEQNKGEKKKALISHVFDYHNTITLLAQCRVVTHVQCRVSPVKKGVVVGGGCGGAISYRSRPQSTSGPGPGRAPARGQASCRSLSPRPSRLLCSQCYRVATPPPSAPLHRPLYAALKAAHVQTLLGKAP